MTNKITEIENVNTFETGSVYKSNDGEFMMLCANGRGEYILVCLATGKLWDVAEKHIIDLNFTELKPFCGTLRIDTGVE